jgi:hypothetical protein
LRCFNRIGYRALSTKQLPVPFRENSQSQVTSIGAVVPKAFAVACIVLVLGAQAALIFPPGKQPRNRYWPFLNYPMYSPAKHLGDSLILPELRAVPCDIPDSSLPVPATTLHVDLGRYWQMLQGLTRPPRREAMLDTLSRLTQSAMHGNVCALELWREVFVVDQRGVRVEDRASVKYARWEIGPSSGRESIPSQ